MRDIRIACFSSQGEHLGRSLRLGEVTRFPGRVSLLEWTEEAFTQADALVYIGACAIAVRAIAPYLKSKLSDPAVICMDEMGEYVIPLLSGHIGGANQLALQIADAVKGCPVITTATDRRHTFAADSWAVEQGLGIVNPEAVKEISSAVLEGEEIVLSVRKRGSLPEQAQLRLIPRNIAVGIGCRKGTDPEYLEACFLDFCRKHRIEPAGVGCIASIDKKAEEKALVWLCARRKIPFRTYSADRLMALEGTYTSSEFVRKTTGADNVCERAAVCACEEIAGRSAQGKLSCKTADFLCTDREEESEGMPSNLICRKEIYDGVTLAAARMELVRSWKWTGADMQRERKEGRLYLVGMGPGNYRDMTNRAAEAIRRCEVLCGYTGYIDIIRTVMPEISQKEIISTPMRGEMERCRRALEAAKSGRLVAMICSGDAGIYGMAGPVLELLEEYPGAEVEVIPGLTAAVSGAALLGAVLMNDFCVVSLSDLMTPWDTIEQRLRGAAAGDFTTVIYNPMSKKRTQHLKRCCEIFLEYRPADTPCGWVRNIGREGEEKKLLTLAALKDEKVDMFTTVYIGSSTMKQSGDYLIAPRGYRDKEGERDEPGQE